jgi:predicted O-methyltransferase YrrM
MGSRVRSESAVPLQRLPQLFDTEPIPAMVTLFLEEAVRRVEQFQHERCIPGFVPSHFPSVYRVLKLLAGCSQLRGRSFCEWGSGFGVVTCLAAMLNYEAVGIEQEPELIELARKLAEDFALPVSYVCGSFLPDETSSTSDGELSAYDQLGFAPEEIDVIFAYPWPDERTQTLELFEEISGSGALFVMFHGGEEVSVQKKIKAKKGK